jgi:hypothetical protein
MKTTIDMTTDRLEEHLLRAEATIARMRTAQMTILREIDRRQTPLADGCRSMVEWVTGRLDVSLETAKTLVATSRRLESLPTVEDNVADGRVSFDRAAAIARIAEPTEDGDIVDEMAVYDVAGIRRLVANRHRISRRQEREGFEQRYVAAQPNLDESSWRIHGLLPGMAGRCLVEALDAKADDLPPDCDTIQSRSTRWADALWAMSLDSLAGSDGATIDAATPLLTVFMDANHAAATNGEAGVVIETGPCVGLDTIEAILCDGIIEVTGRSEDGTPLGMGRRSRAISPRLRRFVLHRDGGACTVEGCASRYRLQAHHIVPWSDGGHTDADNLTTLCWFHHHVVIHGRGFSIDPSSPAHRRRFLRPPIHAPPQWDDDADWQ